MTTARAWRPGIRAGPVFAYLLVCTTSHGILDAMTDGGLGIAFFSPFDPTRYFLPFRPITVSPIGPSRFFTARGLETLASEAVWVWLPSLAVFVVGSLRARHRRRD